MFVSLSVFAFSVGVDGSFPDAVPVVCQMGPTGTANCRDVYGYKRHGMLGLVLPVSFYGYAVTAATKGLTTCANTLTHMHHTHTITHIHINK